MMQRSKTARVLNALHIKKLPPKADWDHSLPIELLEEILEYVMEESSDGRTPMTNRRKAVQPALRKMASLCRGWYMHFTPKLYEEIYLSSSDALASLARAVTKHPHLQPLVHSFCFSGIIFRSAKVELSEADVWNIKRIYRACTNLNSATVQRPLWDFPHSDDEILKTIGLEAGVIEKLTRLEIQMPYGAPCDAHVLFTPEFALPALQELVVENKVPEALYPGTLPNHCIKWPRMPKLWRLCIKNWNVQHRCFRLPEDSKLRVVELLGGDYKFSSGLLNKLRKYAGTLESLTITAVDIDGALDYMIDMLEFTCMTELCIPIKSFARWHIFLPPNNLERLVLAGCPENDFRENDIFVMREVEPKLGELLERRNRGISMRKVKLVRVLVMSIWTWSLGPALRFQRALKAAEAGHVELTFGFLPGEENTFSDNLKAKMYDKFPLLERKLQ